jgi:hypothetical protein
VQELGAAPKSVTDQQYFRRISRARASLESAVEELRNAMEVAPGLSTTRAHDRCAELILIIAEIKLKHSIKIRRAAKAGLAKPGQKSFDDEELLYRIGYLIAQSGGTLKAKTAAAIVAPKAKGGGTLESRQLRLFRKYQKNRADYEHLGLLRLQGDFLREVQAETEDAKRLLSGTALRRHERMLLAESWARLARHLGVS